MPSRIIPLLIGLAGAALALALFFAGACGALDAGLQAWLGFADAPHRLPLWVQVGSVLLLGVGAAYVALDVESAATRRFLLAAGFLQPISAMAVCALAQSWFQPCAPLLAMGFSLLGVSIYRHTAPGRKSRRLRDIFGKNLSRLSLGFLAGEPESGEPADTAVTVLCAKCVEGDWKALHEAAEFFKEHDAWVELQAGSRLLALFNAPVRQERHLFLAMSAALDFREKHPGWQMGLGTGSLVCGIPAEEDVFQVTGPLLDEVEALSLANREFGSTLLVNLGAYDVLQRDFLLRPLGFLPGREGEIYEPLAALDSAPAELVMRRDHFWQGLIFSRQRRFREAAAAFEKAGDDAVTRFFLQRIEEATRTGSAIFDPRG